MLWKPRCNSPVALPPANISIRQTSKGRKFGLDFGSRKLSKNICFPLNWGWKQVGDLLRIIIYHMYCHELIITTKINHYLYNIFFTEAQYIDLLLFRRKDCLKRWDSSWCYSWVCVTLAGQPGTHDGLELWCHCFTNFCGQSRQSKLGELPDFVVKILEEKKKDLK